MSSRIIPPTTTRVERSTRAEINRRIRRQSLERARKFRGAPRAAVMRRLRELEYEWDMERTLEANAAVAALTGLALGRFVSRRWYAFPAIVAGFLLQHAVQGWCPPVEVLRRLGFRTAREIEQERRDVVRLARRPGAPV